MTIEKQALRAEIVDLETKLAAAEAELAEVEKSTPFPPDPLQYSVASQLAAAMQAHKSDFEAHQELLEAARQMPRALNSQLFDRRRQLEKLESAERIAGGGKELGQLAEQFELSLRQAEAAWQRLEAHAEQLGWATVHGKQPLKRSGWRPTSAFPHAEVADDQIIIWSRAGWEAFQRRLGRSDDAAS